MATLCNEALTDPVIYADASSGLQAIQHPGVALALWQRSLPSGLAAALAEVDLAQVDDLSIRLDLPLSEPALATKLALCGYPEDIAKLLAADMALLSACHAVITGSTQLTVRLEVVETDACRRFHADYVTCRMLTTYVGQATQWIRSGHEDAIGQMETGEVGLFKGRLLLPEPPILHRSPPIAGTGERRLLFVVDPEPAAG